MMARKLHSVVGMDREKRIMLHATASLAVLNLDAAIIQLRRLGIDVVHVQQARADADAERGRLIDSLYKPKRKGATR